MGRAEAATSADRPAPRPNPSGSRGHDTGAAGTLAKASFGLARAAAQVGRTGTPEQVEKTVEVLDEAHRRLDSILAQG